MDSALHYTSVSHAHSLVGNINKMRLAADLCDVTVVVGNFRILAHRVVLSACTPFFYQMFYASSKIPSEYRLDNVDETAALKIIEFCYTSAISVTPDLAWPLLAAAALVELPEICGLCCDLLASDLSLTSCLAMHLSAVRLGETAASQLLKASSQFLEENVSQLSTSQQLYDLSEHELIELFKSLTPASAHACSKLAIAWLKRSDVSSQVLAVEKLKQSCPHLVETLTDFLSRSASPAGMTAKDDNADNETFISIAGTSEASYSVDNGSSSQCWNDSGFSETVRRVASGDCEEEDDVHICVRCGDTFDGRDRLLAHQRRQCEDDCDQGSKPTQGDDSGSKLDVNSAQGAQKVCERKETAMSSEDSPPVKLSAQTRSKHRKRVDTLRKAGSNESDGNLTVFEAEKVSPLDNKKDGSDGAVEKEETEAKDEERKEQMAVVNGRETPEANDSNNNDINAKSTAADVDSPDDIDVVNDDAPSLSAACDKPEEKAEGSDGPCGEMLRYQNTLAQGFEASGDEQDADPRLGLDISGMKCQFCGLTVFDDEDELALHWKEVHGVCQDSTHQLNRQAAEELQPRNCNTLDSSYLKRTSGGEDVQEGLDASLKTPVKKPKAENVNGDTDRVSPEMKSDIVAESKLSASPERWPLKSEDLARVKMGEDDSMAGFLQYVQQYNELAKWYMEQGVVFCSACMAYHEKDSQCQKAKVDFKHREAESVRGFKTNGSMVNLKQEGQIDEGSLRENKTQNHLDVDEEEGPLDMSKTSQDFTSPRRDLSRYASSQQTPPDTVAGALKRDQGIRHSKDGHYLTQQQLELAQYYESYSRMMAAVAAVSASSTSSTGSRDPSQFGFPGLYGANSSSIGLGSVPAGFGHSGMFVQASASGPDADGKPAGVLMPAHSGGQDAFSERMIYGTSAAASPPGSLLGKAYGKNLGSPSDMAVYQSQSTVPPAHRRQQTSLPAAHALHETSASAESTAMLKSSFPISPEASLNQNPNASEAVGSGKSQSRKKQGSRQGFPCTVCNRVFSYQAALFTHMKVHSPSARTYQCQLCRRTFDRAPDLKVHVCPNGVEKPYVCPSCGQTFAKNIHLKRHLATHSGLKPYPCWVCGKRFSRSDHLKRHTQSIHAGSRPHGCQLCGKEFVRKYELNKHMLVHTNIVNGEPAESVSSQQNQVSPQQQSDALPSASANPQAVSMQLPVLPMAAST